MTTGGGRYGIGAFAVLSGLSIPTLRHYHEVGLLVPASVDHQTGYRRYAAEQIERARAISTLRAVDMPISEIAELLGESAAERFTAVLAQHRARLIQARARLDESVSQSHRRDPPTGC